MKLFQFSIGDAEAALADALVAGDEECFNSLLEMPTTTADTAATTATADAFQFSIGDARQTPQTRSAT